MRRRAFATMRSQHWRARSSATSGRREPPRISGQWPVVSGQLFATLHVSMHLKILLLPGDGIGVEVTREARRVTEAVCKKFGHTVEFSEGLLGGIAIHQTGTPLPQDTINKALAAGAPIMGAGGPPHFDNPPRP